MDTLIFLAKSFPSHFLPSNIKEAENKSSGKSSKSENKAQRAESKLHPTASSSSDNLKTDFWEMLLRLDASYFAGGTSTKGKGKSLVRPHSGTSMSSDKGSASDDEKGDNLPLEMSPLGLLISMLSHPVIKRSSLLTDRLLRLLALISLGLPDQQNNSDDKTGETATATTDDAVDMSKSETKFGNCDKEEVQDEDMEVDEEKKRERDSAEQQLRLAVEVSMKLNYPT